MVGRKNAEVNGTEKRCRLIYVVISTVMRKQRIEHEQANAVKSFVRIFEVFNVCASELKFQTQTRRQCTNR